MNRTRGFSIGLKLFSSSVINQSVLSATSLLVGVILVRRVPDLQYGYFVLATNTLLLLAGLQNAFFAPPLVSRLTGAEPVAAGGFIGSFFRTQRNLLRLMAVVAAIAVAIAWMLGVLNSQTGPIAFAIIVVALATLNREYFRMVLLGLRRPQDVLRADFAYIAILLACVVIATLSPYSALLAIAGSGLAAVGGGALLSRRVKRQWPWNTAGSPGLLREISSVGLWSCAGAGIHWAFSQGYGYLVAGTLGVPALAAVATTRLLMQPINLLSVGFGTLMLPMATAWLKQHGPRVVLLRLILFALGLGLAAFCYFGIIWMVRDWLFANVLHKSFEQRDPLMILWFAAFVVMVMRDQTMFLLVARSQFRNLTWVTLAAAVTSLTANYIGLKRYGEFGAPLGVLVGEIVSVIGIVVLSIRELRIDEKPLAAQLAEGAQTEPPASDQPV